MASLGASTKVIIVLKEGYTPPFRFQPNLTMSPMHHHRLLCESPQEPLSVGVIASTCEQK